MTEDKKSIDHISLQEQYEWVSKKVADYDPVKQEGDTRTTIALFFVKTYFYLFTLILVGVPLYNLLASSTSSTAGLVLSLNDTLLTFSSIVGSALGFVIGYYFKAREEK